MQRSERDSWPAAACLKFCQHTGHEETRERSAVVRCREPRSQDPERTDPALVAQLHHVDCMRGNAVTLTVSVSGRLRKRRARTRESDVDIPVVLVCKRQAVDCCSRETVTSRSVTCTTAAKTTRSRRRHERDGHGGGTGIKVRLLLAQFSAASEFTNTYTFISLFFVIFNEP